MNQKIDISRSRLSSLAVATLISLGLALIIFQSAPARAEKAAPAEPGIRPVNPEPVLVIEADRTVWRRTLAGSSDLWAVHVLVRNTGPIAAHEVALTLYNLPGNVAVVAATCAFGLIEGGAASLGGRDNAFLFDMAQWRGKPFVLRGEISYEDAAGRAILRSLDVAFAPPAEASSASAANTPSYALEQNAPNPFRSRTEIAFRVPGEEPVSLKIYDVTGKLVRTLVNGQRGEGEYVEVWDGKSDLGRSVASGIYYYRLEAGGNAETKRMVVVR